MTNVKAVFEQLLHCKVIVTDEGMYYYVVPYDVYKDICNVLKEQPEIVRCKDCKYNSGNCNGLYLQFVTCYKTGSPHKEDWFCADGERQ